MTPAHLLKLLKLRRLIIYYDRLLRAIPHSVHNEGGVRGACSRSNSNSEVYRAHGDVGKMKMTADSVCQFDLMHGWSETNSCKHSTKAGHMISVAVNKCHVTWQ